VVSLSLPQIIQFLPQRGRQRLYLRFGAINVSVTLNLICPPNRTYRGRNGEQRKEAALPTELTYLPKDFRWLQAGTSCL